MLCPNKSNESAKIWRILIVQSPVPYAKDISLMQPRSMFATIRVSTKTADFTIFFSIHGNMQLMMVGLPCSTQKFFIIICNSCFNTEIVYWFSHVQTSLIRPTKIMLFSIFVRMSNFFSCRPKWDIPTLKTYTYFYTHIALKIEWWKLIDFFLFGLHRTSLNSITTCIYAR